MTSSAARGILFVHTASALGGSTRVAIDDAKSLVRNGYRIGIAADLETLFDELLRQDIAFHRLYFVDPSRYPKPVRYLIGMPLSAVLLLWIVLRNRYGCLYAQHRQSGIPCRVVSSLTGAAYVFIAHSELGSKTRGRWLTPLGRHIIAVAEHVKRNIVNHFRLPNECVTVISNAVSTDVNPPPVSALRDFDLRWNIPQHAPVVACVADLVPVKAHAVLFQAWRAVVQAIPQAVLILAGSGPLRKSLDRMCREYNLTPNVRFLGRIEDVSLVYARAHLVVLTSLSEGMPLSILEAFAQGVPAVAMAVPGVQEIVVNGENGLWVEPGNVDGLGEAIIHLLKNPEEREKMGLAGRRLVDARYSIEMRSRALCEFFRQT